MNIRFVKIRSGTSDHVVVNAVDVPARQWPGVARRLCRSARGAGADALIGLVHVERGRFALTCLRGDGTATPATVWTAATAALAVRRRYGYEVVRLDAGHVTFDATVQGQRVRLQAGGHQSASDQPAGLLVTVRYAFDGEIAHHAPASDLFAD
jgi:hypothetical protein